MVQRPSRHSGWQCGSTLSALSIVHSLAPWCHSSSANICHALLLSTVPAISSRVRRGFITLRTHKAAVPEQCIQFYIVRQKSLRTRRPGRYSVGRGFNENVNRYTLFMVVRCRIFSSRRNGLHRCARLIFDCITGPGMLFTAPYSHVNC